jgi:hypothetical protein
MVLRFTKNELENLFEGDLAVVFCRQCEDFKAHLKENGRFVCQYCDLICDLSEIDLN